MSNYRFDGESFFELIKEFYDGDYPFLSTNSDVNHAFRRTCISRIYYSIFLQIKKKYYVKSKGISDSHTYVISFVPQPSHRNDLHDMKDLRLNADYDLEIVVDTDDVADQFKLYNDAIANI